MTTNQPEDGAFTLKASVITPVNSHIKQSDITTPDGETQLLVRTGEALLRRHEVATLHWASLLDAHIYCNLPPDPRNARRRHTGRPPTAPMEHKAGHLP